MISKSESVTYLTKDEETVHVFHAHNQYVLLVTFLFWGGRNSGRLVVILYVHSEAVRPNKNDYVT